MLEDARQYTPQKKEAKFIVGAHMITYMPTHAQTHVHAGGHARTHTHRVSHIRSKLAGAKQRTPVAPVQLFIHVIFLPEVSLQIASYIRSGCENSLDLLTAAYLHSRYQVANHWGKEMPQCSLGKQQTTYFFLLEKYCRLQGNG